MSPAGPPPMMATVLPVASLGVTGSLVLCSIAQSPMYCSTPLMPTKSSTSLRLQPSSHGAGQTRPITDGNGFASTMRWKAYSCQAMPFAGGLSICRAIINQPRISWPEGHEPWHGGVRCT